MEQTKSPKMAPFHITQADGNITAANGVTGTWSDIYKYQVPQGVGIILQTGDQFSAYIKDASAEVGLYDCWVKIEVRDAAELDKQVVFGPSLYKKIREFQDRDTIAHLELSEPVKAYPRQWIVIVGKDTGTITVANCYFSLLTSKVAQPL